jgi:hypothetical protein
MFASIVGLLIQIVSGIVGGNVLANAMSRYDLGRVGNIVVGALGGLAGGQVLGGILGNPGGSLDLGSLLTQIIGGGAGGAILTAMVALVANAMGVKRT